MSVLCANAYKSGSSKYMKERTFSLIPQYIANDIYLIWDYITAIGNGAHEYIVHTEEKFVVRSLFAAPMPRSCV